MAIRPALARYQDRGHIRVTAPTVEPVFAEELRTFLKTDFETLQDTEADFYIVQAREFLEEFSGLAFITQTWRLALDAWPGYLEPWWDGMREIAVTELQNGRARKLELPRYPLASITSVKTYNETSVETAVTVSTYFDVDTVRRPGRMSLKFGQVWPTATRSVNAIIIDYVAGFGDEVTDVPAGLRAAILNLAAYYYQHRGECDMREAAQKSGALDALAAYQVRSI